MNRVRFSNNYEVDNKDNLFLLGRKLFKRKSKLFWNEGNY